MNLLHLKPDVLKKSIDVACGAVIHRAGGFQFNEPDGKFTKSLRKLLDAAFLFHY